MTKVFINPGHGGDDCGAVGNGLKERDVVLSIGKRVETYLQAVGYTVKLFQYDGLGEICADANNWRADLFVSIHCNAATGNAKGTETIFYEHSANGKKLADCIQQQIISSLGTVNRGLKSKIGDGYDAYVTKYTNCPAVLVECAFIDNPDDAKLLIEREDDFARAIARGVTDYFQGVNKPLPDVLDTPKFSSPKLSKHFDVSEFTCHCCGQGADLIDNRLIDLLEQLRVKAGVPVHVNCGYRCPNHNAEVGGVKNSQHLKGTAADITIPKISFERAVDFVRALPFDYTGFYPPIDSSGLWFIHVDVRNGASGSHIEEWN